MAKILLLMVFGGGYGIFLVREGRAVLLEEKARIDADSIILRRLDGLEKRREEDAKISTSLGKIRCYDRNTPETLIVMAELPCDTLTRGEWRRYRRLNEQEQNGFRPTSGGGDSRRDELDSIQPWVRVRSRNQQPSVGLYYLSGLRGFP
jgi:hypothetical protein